MKKIFKVLFLIVVSAIVVWYLIGFFLNLEQETEPDDIEKRMNNQVNFYHWSANRVQSLDRK